MGLWAVGFLSVGFGEVELRWVENCDGIGVAWLWRKRVMCRREMGLMDD